LDGGINTFGYVDSNPLVFVDEEGLQSRPEPGSGFARRMYEEKGGRKHNPNYWGRPETLERHYRDHGKDFGSNSPGHYAHQAREFFRQCQMDRLPTKVGPDGVIRNYDPKTNTFGAYNADGTTRTFYKPDPASHKYPTNMDYWNAQPGTSPWSPKR
jgi:hypothetical protein